MMEDETAGMYGEDEREQPIEADRIFPPDGQAVEDPSTTIEIEQEKEEDSNS
jgi:hypothetical protein